MLGTVLSQKPRRLQRFRNESSFAQSDAEQRPDHAGRQYVILARMVARNTLWSDTAVLALDISAAFNAVDHATLTDHAHTVFGFPLH